MALAARSLFDDLEETTKSCQTDALLIRGHESKFVSPTAFARTQVLRPDFEYREVAETDHHVPEERPTEVFAIIADFAVRHGLLNAHDNAA
jgi:pimeloyl-ACP methyl ester carboxylesterase